MQPKTPRWLEDIADEAGFVLDETAGRTLAEYEADRRLRYAIERSFEIIGEALARIERTDPATAGRITEHRKIIGFRNRLAHGYDATDHALVWQVIQEALPTLKAEGLLGEVGEA
jgi:uncharacterized protein with HEPN domain